MRSDPPSDDDGADDSPTLSWMRRADILPGPRSEASSAVARAWDWERQRPTVDRPLLALQIAHLTPYQFLRVLADVEVDAVHILPPRVEPIERAQSLMNVVERRAGTLHELVAAVDNHISRGAPGPFMALARDPLSYLGKSISGYRLLKFLGQGGSGAVYRARKHSTGREVALKLTYPFPRTVTPLMGEMWSTIHGLQTLRHRSTVDILDVGEAELEPPTDEARPGANFSLFMSMSLVQGYQFLPWARAQIDASGGRTRLLECCAAIAACLQACHEAHFTSPSGFSRQGIFHGDIKPENILVETDCTPVVLDFLVPDIHRLMDLRIYESLPYNALGLNLPMPLTASYGTVGFMSPEQEEHGVLTSKGDIYSLGQTITRIFYDESWPLKLQLRRHEYLLGMPDLYRLLRCMLAQDPSDRPPTMAAVHEELGRIIALYAEPEQ